MTPQKYMEVILRYRAYFEEARVPAEAYPHDGFSELRPFNIFDRDSRHALAHCHYMLDEMEKFIFEGRMEKVARWLGFIQGCLWAQGIYTIKELKEHNIPQHPTADTTIVPFDRGDEE